jgi:hypothetical protein
MKRGEDISREVTQYFFSRGCKCDPKEILRNSFRFTKKINTTFNRKTLYFLYILCRYIESTNCPKLPSVHSIKASSIFPSKNSLWCIFILQKFNILQWPWYHYLENIVLIFLLFLNIFWILLILNRDLLCLMLLEAFRTDIFIEGNMRILFNFLDFGIRYYLSLKSSTKNREHWTVE